MTLYSVLRFRAAVLHMYLRIAVIVTLPLSVLYYLLAITPSKGLAAFAFALWALWLSWRTRHDSEESLRYANWFVLAILCLMLYAAYISNAILHQEVWLMIFPITFAPIVAARERISWVVVGAAGLAAVVMLRPAEPFTAISAFVFVIVYLTLCFIAMMLVRHNERNIERLAHLTIVDPLTNVFNRGHLEDVLAGEINRCKRSAQPLTVIMLDIDHFKMLNDDHGHVYGDTVLERVAEALKGAAQRAGDYVFRYGGEEFCVLTSGLSRDEAWKFAEKLRLGISSLEVENLGSPHFHLTASAGFWWVPDVSDVTPGELLVNADNALYRAKAAGRNAVVDFDAVVPASSGSGEPQGEPPRPNRPDRACPSRV